MTERPVVRILCEGWFVRAGEVVVDASSTVTMLGTDAGIVIVDTGSRARWDGLSSALSEIDVRPEMVRHVVNTHLHSDHYGANDMFPNAILHAHVSEGPPVGTRTVTGEVGLARGVRLVHTPGHTKGSISILVESDRRYAICGDAIPTKANYDSHVPPSLHFDRALAVRSMDMLLGWAQTVVPGHDKPFTILAKE